MLLQHILDLVPGGCGLMDDIGSRVMAGPSPYGWLDLEGLFQNIIYDNIFSFSLSNKIVQLSC